MKSFLLQLAKDNKKVLSWTTWPLIPLVLWLWTFDLQRLSPSGKIEPRTLWELRMFLSLSIALMFLLSLLIITLIAYKKNHVETNNPAFSKNQFDLSLFAQILKLRGLNQIASAKRISSLTKNDVNVILAHLNKLHNDQYVTYQTGGKAPTIDTDFFLTEKANHTIQIQPKSSKNRRIRHPGIRKI